MQALIPILKAAGLFFVRKMLLQLALDMVEDALVKGAAKSEAKWDDGLAQSFTENKAELKKVIQGVL